MAKLSLQLNNLENLVSDVKKYAYVATLSVYGSPFSMSGAVMINTPISNLMVDTLLKQENNRAIFKCDEISMEKYREVIEVNSNFPFSYYALAFCLQQQNNPEWRDFAFSAFKILQTTTTIDGHNRNHDEIFLKLKPIFQSP